MKFLFGLILGVVGTFGVFWMLYMSEQPSRNIDMFSEPGKCLTKQNLTVFQVLGKGMALTRTKEWTVMLLLGKDESYYDDEIIQISPKHCARQVGTYQYPTRDNNYKTVPVVRIESI